MARTNKLWSFCTLLSSRGGELDDMRRQIMVIPLTFSPFRDNRVQMARRDKLWSFCALLSSRGGEPDDMRRQIMVIPLTFSPFRDNHVRWHAETNYGHFAPFCHPEAANPMTCGDKLWSLRTFCHPDTIVSDGTQRQILVIPHLLPSRYDRV